jgi:hypothetical protein
MTKNDWFKHNLANRLTDPSCNLKITINPGQYTKMSFDEACDYTAKQIYKDLGPSLYLALSGGYDSEFVLRVFQRNNIPIIPIVVMTGGNQKEAEYAFKACPDPALIGINEQIVLKTYYTEIYQKLNSYGIHSVPALLCGQYAQERGGNLVVGEHIIDGTTFRVNDWDFYNDVLLTNKTAEFFIYTPEVVYAMTYEMTEDSEQQWKDKLYKLKSRPIHSYQYTKAFDTVLKDINSKRQCHPNPSHLFGNKNQMLDQMSVFDLPCNE